MLRDPQGPARPVRGLLRGQLRVRPLPRPAPPAGRPGPGGPPRAAAADLPVEEQERPQRRRAAGQAAVPRRDADGARALARGPGLAGADQLPRPGDRQADAGQERRSARCCAAPAWSPRRSPACGRRRGWPGSASWSCRRPRSSCGGTCCSRRSRRSTRQVRRIEQELNRQARQTPAVARLRTIPGVGARTAEAVAAFIDDPHRFRERQGGRPVLRAGPQPGPVGRPEPARAHHPRGAAGRPPAGGRGRLAGDPPVADRPGLLRAGPAGRPAAAEDRPGGHGPLPGAGDVGDAAARDHLAGERGPGRVTRLTFPEPRARGRSDQLHVEIESGTQVASRGPTWRIATPLV